MVKELWLDVVGYEGVYKVSNKGRIKRLKRCVYREGKVIKRLEEIILKSRLGTSGYPIINLRDVEKGVSKTHLIHRLVAEAFIQKRETKETLIVNHKDGNKENNNLENLEWVTYSENKKHAQKLGLHKDNVEGFLRHAESRMIPLVMIKNNKVIKTARNSREMAEYIVKNKLIVGTKETTIARSIRSRLHDNKSYKGYYFQRLEDIELI